MNLSRLVFVSGLLVFSSLLSALGDRRDPPLTNEQASCVAKLGAMLFAARLNHP